MSLNLGKHKEATELENLETENENKICTLFDLLHCISLKI